MEIETKLGTLRAELIDDDEYPGIMLKWNGLELCWMEVDQTGDEPVLKIHAYSPNMNIDEPVYDAEYSESRLLQLAPGGKWRKAPEEPRQRPEESEA